MRAFFEKLKPYFLLFLGTQFIVRLSLLVRALMDGPVAPADMAQLFARGLWFDVVTAGFVLIPVALVFLFTRGSFWTRTPGRYVDTALRFAFLYVMFFDAVAEHLFWDEFTTRFNFIAVDYLVYTTEVIGNIVESYPLGWLLSAIGVVSAAGAWIFRPRAHADAGRFGLRLAGFAVYVVLIVLGYSLSNSQQSQFSQNAEANEVAANGIYNLFYAYGHNEINYEQFYATRDPAQVKARIRALLANNESKFINDKDFARVIKREGPELHKNVIIVVMESMSGEYMGVFGNKQNLTPNLDRLGREGLLFTNLYATGTRTVRGLEAVTLSVPPTPGQSIVRRPGNENLYSLGSVFQDRGYDTKFIYGGHGYFDNMNAFYAGNGFGIADRATMTKDEVHFSNVWGVADDDLFARVLSEADKNYAAGRPFMDVIMTTSNHRPYTFPEGRIDQPQLHREGGVKYADYAVGKLIEWAKDKPWYKNTVFVFVADHTANAGGKTELDPKKYHIPLIFYAPGFIKPQIYDQIASQIDLAPTLLGLLNFSYATKFYGTDVLNEKDVPPHAFISNYQKVALIKDERITVLEPKRGVTQFNWSDHSPIAQPDADGVDDAIGYYQSASWWRENFRREPTVIAK